MTIKEALSWSTRQLQKAEIESAFLDSEVLLSFTLKKDRAYLFAHPERKVTIIHEKIFCSCIKKRIKRIPVAYITGMKEFYGLPFFVDKSTLIPRRETELLVDAVLHECSMLHAPCSMIIDVGSGSGCIAISLAKHLPKTSIYATDISSKALTLAKKNAKLNRVQKNIKFHKSNLLSLKTLHSSLITHHSIIVANLPYLSYGQYMKAKNDCPELAYEPKNALVATEKGLGVIKKLLLHIKTRRRLGADGRVTLCLEIDPSQAKLIQALSRKILVGSRCIFQRDLARRIRIAKISF